MVFTSKGSVNFSVGNLFSVVIADLCLLNSVFSEVWLLGKLYPVTTSEHHISRYKFGGWVRSRGARQWLPGFGVVFRIQFGSLL